MAAIGQIDLAGTASSRGVGSGATVTGLNTEVQDELNRLAEVDRAGPRDTAGARPPAGDDQSSGSKQVDGAANVNQANAVTSDDNQQLEIREDLANQDQQLPTPVNPN
jgi:hypothetical protein